MNETRLELLWCPELGIYRLSNPKTRRERAVSQDEINAAGELLVAVSKAAQANPNIPIDFYVPASA